VLAGLAALAVIGLALWGISAFVSGNEKVQVSADLAERYFRPGGVERLSKLIAEDGPLLFPSLVGDAGRKPIGIGHVGTDPLKGWRVFSLVPPGSAADCILALDQTTGRLGAPCIDRVFPPDGAGLYVLPVTAVTIDPDEQLVVDLRALPAAGAPATTAVPATTAP
jgi:hypothetical protein